MSTYNEAKEFFKKETLYELASISRTSPYRFIVRAYNIATNEWFLFIVDMKNQTVDKLCY